MGSARYDAVVIGGGHNGLAAAITLARKGKSVCVVEKADAPGGMARAAELAEGVHVPQIAHLLFNLNPKLARELGLGDLLSAPALPTVSLDPDGRHVVIDGDNVRFADGSSHPDADAFASLNARLRKFAALLMPLAMKPPPGVKGGLANPAAMSELAGLARLGINLKRLGKKDMQEFLRVVLSNMFDLVLDELEDGPLAGAICADAVRGNYVGPRSPGTVFNMMYRLGAGGQARLPKGGMGAVVQAFEDAARRAGCDILTGSGVAQVLVDDDRTAGVVLEDGREIAARAVLSSLGPLQTAQLTGVGHFDVEAVRRMRNMRCKGTVAKLNLVLKSAPSVSGLSADLRSARLLIAPSAEDVERSFNPAKYNELPASTVIEAVIPTLSEPGLAATGQHVLSAIVQYVPHTPAGGWTDDNRAVLRDTVLRQLEAHMPGLGSLVEHAELLTPSDIEDMTGAPGGHWHHAEMGVDQLLTVRPVNGLAHYRFAVGGLFLCGASAHPGGDVTGLPGRNSALQAIRDGVFR